MMNNFNTSTVGNDRYKNSTHTKQHRANSLERFIYTLVSATILGICVCTLLFVFVFKMMSFTGDSMRNTLYDGDRILVNILDKQPAQGDIAVVVGSKGDNRAVKRVIATGGQTVNIDYDTDTVYVNGQAISESYLYISDMTAMGDVVLPITVPENCYFVMGDNRNVSLDSRFSAFGMVKQEEVVGTVLLSYNNTSGIKLLEKTPIDTDIEAKLDQFVDDVYELLQ